MTTSETFSAGEPSGVQPDEPVLLHSDSVSVGGDDKDRGYTEPIWDQ